MGGRFLTPLQRKGSIVAVQGTSDTADNLLIGQNYL